MWNPPGCSSSPENPANISLFDEDPGPNASFSCSSSTMFNSDEPVFLDSSSSKNPANISLFDEDPELNALISCSHSTSNYDPFLSELHNFDSDEPVFLDLDRQTGSSEVWSQDKAQQNNASQWVFDDDLQENTPTTNGGIYEEIETEEFSQFFPQNSTNGHREKSPKDSEKSQEKLHGDFPYSSTSNSIYLPIFTMPSPPSQDDVHSEPMTTEKINRILDRPHLSCYLLPTKKIAEEMQKWLKTRGINVQRFAFCILGRKNRYCGFHRVRDWREMRSDRRKDYQRMLNWLKLSSAYQNRIMDFMNENHGNLTSDINISSETRRRLREYFQQNQYPSSQKKTEIANELGILEYSVESYFAHLRSSPCQNPNASSLQTPINRPEPLTVEEVNALLDAPISLIDRPTTEKIAKLMKGWSECQKVSIKYFARHILGREGRYDGLSRPFTWDSIRDDKKKDFIRMFNWLKIDETMKHRILKFVKANDGVLAMAYHTERKKRYLEKNRRLNSSVG